jgi:hypothetical protein
LCAETLDISEVKTYLTNLINIIQSDCSNESSSKAILRGNVVIKTDADQESNRILGINPKLSIQKQFDWEST